MASKTKVQASQSIIGAGLPQAASQILINNISAKTIAGGEGANPKEIPPMVTLYLVVLDMTGSMKKNLAAVLQAYDEMVKALKDSKAADSILMSTWVFNDTAGTKLVHSYLPIDLVPSLAGYYPDNMTNLFDATLDGITSLLQYEEDLRQAGTGSQSVIVSFTDGVDNVSKHVASDVQTVIKGLLTKEKYIFSLVAFGDDLKPDEIADEMGIPNSNVLSVGSTAHDIRLAMGTVSKSVIRTSQTKIGGQSQSGFFTP